MMTFLSAMTTNVMWKSTTTATAMMSSEKMTTNATAMMKMNGLMTGAQV
jgi:hypothetical protein